MKLKRVVDMIVAALVLVLASPLLLLLALVVRVNLGSPVLFRQQQQ
jgi:lipopolysaccharide/colanic/teichoic acid biosynthesis glycosyltransferase